MTTQDARERAWQEWEATHVRAWIARAAFEDGWDAAKREDEQRIAALVGALRELVIQVERSNAVDDHGHRLENLQALEDARRALTGSEEALR